MNKEFSINIAINIIININIAIAIFNLNQKVGFKLRITTIKTADFKCM